MTAQDTDRSAAAERSLPLPPPEIVAAVELLRQWAFEGDESEEYDRRERLRGALAQDKETSTYDALTDRHAARGAIIRNSPEQRARAMEMLRQLREAAAEEAGEEDDEEFFRNLDRNRGEGARKLFPWLS